MIKRSRTKEFAVFFVILGIYGLMVTFSNNSVKTSTTSVILVESKKRESADYWIYGYDPNKKQMQTIRIRFKQKKDWETIQTNRSYILTYEAIDNEVWFRENLGFAEPPTGTFLEE